LIDWLVKEFVAKTLASKVKGIRQKGEFGSVGKYSRLSFFSVFSSKNCSAIFTSYGRFIPLSLPPSCLSSLQVFPLDPLTFPFLHCSHSYAQDQFHSFCTTFQDKISSQIDKKTNATVSDINRTTTASIFI
jgi:hypothetical protein